MKKWEIIKSDYIVNNRWLKLRADTCVIPDGHTIEPYYVFEYKDWVNCFVIDAKLNVIMLKHYRHGVQDEVLEIVGGGIEDTDASPLNAIKRELKEELGYTDGEVYQTGISYPNPSNQTNKVYSFIAFGGSCTVSQELEKGENLKMHTFNLKDIVCRLENTESKEIFQSLHLASVFFALNFIRKSSLESLKTLKSALKF